MLSRSGVTKARRPRLLFVLAAVTLVAVFTASALAVRGFILDKGFVGLPPAGAKPSSPEGGELVLHWGARSATAGGALFRTWVYDDGRIIWSREGSIPEGANEFTSGLLERRLTPEGLELLRSQLVASGLFDRSRTLAVREGDGGRACRRAQPGVPADLPGNLPVCLVWGEVEVHDGNRPIRLRWSNPHYAPWAGDGPRGAEAATPEQHSTLVSIDRLLGNPASVLPARAWADRAIRAYVPSHYDACLLFASSKDVSSLLSLLPTRAEDLLRRKSRTTSLIQGAMVDSHCSKLTTAEARELVDALTGLASAQGQSRGLLYRLAEPVDGEFPPQIFIDPYLPHGEIGSLWGG